MYVSLCIHVHIHTLSPCTYLAPLPPSTSTTDELLSKPTRFCGLCQQPGPHTTHTYVTVDMHAHTDTHSHTHSYTLIYHHTLPFNSGRSQSHSRSVIIKEVSNGSGEKTKAFVSLNSTTTTTVCSRTKPTPSYFFKPGVNILNCHSHKTAHIEIKA